MNNNSNEVNNSEILFLYDCKECNPNGDPDNENKPRMDMARERLLVSDVRLKRYIRDYFLHYNDFSDKTKNIFVSKVDNRTVDATERYAHFVAELIMTNDKYKEKVQKHIKPEMKKEDVIKKIIESSLWELVDIKDFLSYFIDIRLFGVTLPIKAEGRGSSITFIGPMQFNWGYSLNHAELIESPSITSYFAGRTKNEGEEGGAIGKDWRVYYGLIAFYGRVSGNSAKETELSKEDLESFDKAIWNSILTETNTRTKLNQHPRFYLRVEFNDKETVIGDLRRYVSMDKTEGLRDVNEYTLNIERLAEKLSAFQNNIHSIILKKDDDLKIEGIEKIESLKAETDKQVKDVR